MLRPDSSSGVTVRGPWKPDRGLGFDVTGTGRHCREEGRE